MVTQPTMADVEKAFFLLFSKMRPKQKEALLVIIKSKFRHIFEMPTGEGKTAVLLACLMAMAKKTKGLCFYVTPTKTQVEQIAQKHGDQVIVMYGRAEYPCLYYQNKGQENISAEDSPCYFLKCPHRVDQDTGQTAIENAAPCPYYLQKYLVRNRSQGRIIVCTTAFFMVNRVLVPDWREMEPALVCVDEIHNIAKVARRIFQYSLTDYHLYRLVDMLMPIDSDNAEILRQFANKFKSICWRRETYQPTLLENEDITMLMQTLNKINRGQLETNIKQAIKSGRIDPESQRQELNTLQNLVFRIRRLIKSLAYSLESQKRQPLSYVVAFYYKKDDPEFADSKKKARFFLTVYSYYVRPIIKSALGEKVVGCSATIGDPKILAFESGLDLPFSSYDSSFNVDHCRIYMPTDTPNLAKNKRLRNDLNRTLRLIVETAHRFAQKGQRSLIVVISESERQKILEYATQTGLNALSYGNGIHPKESAEKFKNGEGDALVGTSSNYSEGVDLPKNIAPVIFFLRPGYARPDDPEAQFEDRRFSENHVWALRNWRVMIEALQVRGRNIRTAKDMGVCFFISQGFRKFLFSSLPDWLKPAYRKELTMEKAVKETLTLLQK